MAQQLEQLLTCCICLDRFRNPKLLPCQHSVCMEPCMEGLVDYVRRQVKCPECRAEHRIPYNGVQGFPSNVTLQRFLEAHIEITGETPDPHTGQYMERCNVCNEKNYLSVCSHCEKKICEDCKAAHLDILKREIGRINNQVKRASHRLNDQLSTVERNITSLKQNTTSVSDEIENISKRLQKSVRDRCSFLKAEVENYYGNEFRNLTMLKESLDQEVSNIGANIELAEKHMDDQTPWDDAELMDAKDIFLKTMEFIRSFDYEAGDYSRRARFNPPDDLNKLTTSLSTLGDLTFSTPNKMSDGYSSGPSMGSGLMKSKSDHRLAAQFRDQEDGYGYTSGRTSPLMRRRFGERNTERHDEDSSADSGRRRFRSRFMRKEEDEERSVRFAEEDGPKRQRVFDTEDVSRGPLSGIVRLYDSPRVMKRFQERDQNKTKKKEEPPKPAQPTLPKPPATPIQRKTSRQTSNEDEIDKIKKQNKNTDSTSGATATTPTANTSTPSTPTTPKPAGERVSSIRDDERQSRSDRTSTSPRSSANHSPASSITREDDSSRRNEYSRSRAESNASGANGTTSRPTPARKTSVDTGVTSVAQRAYPFSRSSSNSSVGDKDKNTSGTRSPRTLDTAGYERRLSRSNSTDSNKSGDGSSSPKKATGAAFSTEELKNRFVRTDSKPSTSKVESSSRSSGPSNSRFQSRFLGRAGTPSVETSKESGNEDEDDETTEDSESEESEESSEEEEEEEEEKEPTSEYSRADIGPLLGKSAQARDVAGSTSSRSTWGDRSSYPSASTSGTDSGYASRYGSNSDNSNGSSNNSSRYGAPTSNSSSTDAGATSHRRPSYLDSAKPQAKEKEDEFESKYPYSSKYLNRSRAAVPEEDSKPTFQSRFLNRSKSSAVLGPDDNDESTPTTTHGTGRARFEELKERRQRLARSKSSAGLEDDEGTAADTNSAANYRPRYGRVEPEASATTRNTAAGTSSVGAAGSSSNAGGDNSGSSSTQLSNWARYLKNKYGNRSGAAAGGGDSSSRSTGTGLSGSTSTSAGSGLGSNTSSASGIMGSGSRPGTSSTVGGRAISRSRSSHLLGLAKEGESSEDDSKNVHATPTFPPAGTQVPTPFGSLHRSQYLQKQRLLIKIGSRGSEPGNFTWPRGIAVGPDNSIVVADSSNHRVQVFDQQGKFIKEFGSYGSAEGEFDCLAGVAVNRIGQYIIADRYNHRIQVFDPSGMFLRSFGSQGGGDGRFSYPWGVTTDALGFIYVCDKENHRVQVFQSDGSFVGKFGSMGNKPGQLEHPHYIAVSSTNRVIVSDSNNHRIQIFDINGKVTTTFGSEGSDEGQFKFPRGVAVDDQGYIFVADSGNNRIQIFHPDGSFLRAFGCWGSGEGEFKGLEGVAVMSNGNILVCDRENHRVQVF
ncbi:RING finger protein nhl-1-like [Homarus americanus]|uniref:RING finger protein nhl-1-like n=1 Tax=Homarus americanus TaxID=6706 RepID=UPI001C488E6D|nr:RING finger protein nhl-1-like [Homarus americanus]XP_042240204.1 RING finger protein nhl-1-like [Homarus americanus]XP_042240213.1 RING finger protein nhl-1-like [Homarus americanus]